MFPHYYLFPILTKVYNGLLFKEELGGPHRGRFLILSVEAGPPKTRRESRQGRFYTKNVLRLRSIQGLFSLSFCYQLCIIGTYFLPCHLVCLVLQVLPSRQCKIPTLVRLGGLTKDRNVGKTDDQFYLFCFDYKLNKGFAGY